jgi:hypothetical protein
MRASVWQKLKKRGAGVESRKISKKVAYGRRKKLFIAGTKRNRPDNLGEANPALGI